MNYTYQILTPQDIVLGISRLDIDYEINNGGTIGCSTGYTLTISTDPSQPNRATYIFRTCIITEGRIPCNSNIIPTSITSVTLDFISSTGNRIVSINIEDNFSIAQNYCLIITFIVIDNNTTQDIENIIISTYDPEGIIDYVSRPTQLVSHDKNRLMRSYHNRVSTNPVRYTNSISDVVSNCNFVPYLAVQDRYFVINYEDDVTSEYATVSLPDVKISGWTDRDVYFFEKVYADVSDPSVMITNDMGLLEPAIQNPESTSTPFTLVHNMYPISINRNGEIVAYNNQPKDFPYVTSLFHTANVSQIRYNGKVYKPLTPYMYYHTTAKMNARTEVEILYSYLNRSYIAIAKLESLKVLSATGGSTNIINMSTVTRSILLPIDYNMLFYVESQWSRLLENDDMRIFIQNYQRNNVEYPAILNNPSGWSCKLVMFKRDGSNAVTLDKQIDIDMNVMRWDTPMSFFSGGGLLGWGRHQPNRESKYYLFSWYKILRTKRLVSNTSNTPRPDDYLRYYYYYQHII